MTGPNEGRWRKSTYSAEQAECVEVASLAPRRMIVVRDSKNPNGPRLHLTGAQWGAFLEQITRDDPVLDACAQGPWPY